MSGISVVSQVSEYFKSLVGLEKEEVLGVVDRLMIRRYALAIGEHNPLYHDAEFARKQGYKDIIAPLNMLPSIVDWTAGVKEEEMHIDGTPKSSGIIPPKIKGVRIMGGGETMTFFTPLTAGSNVILATKYIDTYTKEGSKGLIAFIVIKNLYKDDTGKVFCESKRTIIAR